MNAIRSAVGLLLLLTPLRPAGAQQTSAPLQQIASAIPVRVLGTVIASGAEALGTILKIRALSDGRVFVNDVVRRRVMLFSASLEAARVVVDTVGGAEPTATVVARLASATLLSFAGDSTLYADRTSQSLLLFDANGKLARVMALPAPQDITYIAAGFNVGDAAIDPTGRLLYRARFRAKPLKPQPNARTTYPFPVQADSAPIVRADFDKRTVDTLTSLKLNPSVVFDHLDTDAKGDITARYRATFQDVDDQWSMLSDGTVAVVSVHDYHVEFVDQNGTHRSGPKMPYDWKRIDEAQKKFRADSMRPELDRISSSPPRPVITPEGPHTIRSVYELMPLDKIGDYESPLQLGSLVPDRNARLWIVPRTSVTAKDGLLYDVVSREGLIVERVQFPKNRVLVGFGDQGRIYVARIEGGSAFLEQYRIADLH